MTSLENGWKQVWKQVWKQLWKQLVKKGLETTLETALEKALETAFAVLCDQTNRKPATTSHNQPGPVFMVANKECSWLQNPCVFMVEIKVFMVVSKTRS